MFVIKNHYKLLAIDLGRQKELAANPKAMKQIEFAGKFRKLDGVNADGAQFMFISMVLKIIKETRLKLSQGSVSVL